MEEAKALFRNADTTQFIIVTIPTVMAAAESARLAEALRKEGVPLKLMVINQVSTTVYILLTAYVCACVRACMAVCPRRCVWLYVCV